MTQRGISLPLAQEGDGTLPRSHLGARADELIATCSNMASGTGPGTLGRVETRTGAGSSLLLLLFSVWFARIQETAQVHLKEMPMACVHGPSTSSRPPVTAGSLGRCFLLCLRGLERRQDHELILETLP